MTIHSIIEERIAGKAVAALYAKSGLRLELIDKNTVLGTGLWPDMRFRIEGSELELVCEIKTGLCRDMLEPVVKLLQTAVEGRPPMIMANYIDAKLGRALREFGVNYADVSGNAYIKLGPYFIFIEGQIIADGLSQTRSAKQFSSTDLQVIYALLTNPNLLNQNYREVSQCANVTLGVCGSVFRELKDQGYFVEAVSTKKREWRAKHKLIGRWVEQYPMLIKRAFLGEFSTPKSDWMLADSLSNFDAQLGGKVAVAKYAQAEVGGYSVYVNDQQQWQFIRQMGLTKDAENSAETASSNVKVFSKFWGRATVSQELDKPSSTASPVNPSTVHPTKAHPSIVHPLMAYAELIQTGDHRSRDAANRIASRYFV
ncbi:MAG: hypothetical protein JKX81_13020 [Arenicella sp.]|nr:hypothetical protein [Arenicella sp.]